MIFENTLRQKLSEAPPGAVRRDILAADADTGWTVRLTIDKNDELSCLIHELVVRRSSPAAADLPSWAEHLAGQLKGLMEALVVLEVDTERNQAILRSDSPTRRNDVRSYFEVLLTGTNSALLRRYQVPAEGMHKREHVSFAITHDGLFKLVDDLTSR